MESWPKKSEREIEDDLIWELGWHPERVSQERANFRHLGYRRFSDYLRDTLKEKRQDERQKTSVSAALAFRRPSRASQPGTPPPRPLEEVLREISQRYGALTPVSDISKKTYVSVSVEGLVFVFINNAGEVQVANISSSCSWPTRVDPSTLH